MSELPIEIPREELADFCRCHHVRRLSFFGSILTPNFRPDSDIDILVEFTEGVPVGLFARGLMQQDLTELFGREVDLKTPGDLSRFFRESVVREASVQYVA